MLALSLRQPWAWAILHAGKRIENRRWNTHYRGHILLHAAKGCMADEHEDAIGWMVQAGVIKVGDHWPEWPHGADRGGIVGRARIVDVVRPWCPDLRVGGEPLGAPPFPSTLEKFYPPGVDHRWHMVKQFGFVLDDVQPMPFRPYPGSLGLFRVPEYPSP